MKLDRIFQVANRWLLDTPGRSLDEAYRAAIKIKDIEDKHFQGRKVSGEFSNYGGSVTSYFISSVKRHLRTIEVRLVEFRFSRSIVDTFGPRPSLPTDGDGTMTVPEDIWLEKLNIIDSIIVRYRAPDGFDTDGSPPSKRAPSARTGPVENPKPRPTGRSFLESGWSGENRVERADRPRKATDEPGVLPRSFVGTLNRIRQELEPRSEGSEKAILKEFRTSRYKTAISIKFVLLLIIVPLLTHQVSKTFLISPAIDRYFTGHEEFIFLNRDLEGEAVAELKKYEEVLRFREMIATGERPDPREIEGRVRRRARDLSEEYRARGLDAIANIVADIFSLAAFGFVIACSRREIEIVRGFLDDKLYKLSDSAKAFLIILFTDIFVGFHSPHGWEVILENLWRHFGLPENRDFNFIFIATFPVILDTILKYWIFRYLNRISPSAVATYRNMNE